MQWVGDEAEKRLAEFFPSLPGERVQNYLWAHTVVCPSCQSVVPLSPNWWLSKTSNYAGKGQARKVTSDWYAVKPIPNPKKKRVDFELIKGSKGKGTTIKTDEGEFDPNDYNTISRGVGKCPNCGSVIEDDAIKSQAQSGKLGHQMYAVAFKKGKGSLEFRLLQNVDFDGVNKANYYLKSQLYNFQAKNLIPDIQIPYSHMVHERNATADFGLTHWHKFFNPRQLLTLVTYVEIINDVKLQLQAEYEPDKVEAIATYLALILDRCVDLNSRLSNWIPGVISGARASAQHSLNLMWSYPEVSGSNKLWFLCYEAVASNYSKLCTLINAKPLPIDTQQHNKTVQIDSASADTLYHIPNSSVDAIITDPPYYATIQYAELSDFFYVWQRRVLGDIFPNLYLTELTDKDREAVANPSRFRNMGTPPEKLANKDYEAKMALTFAEHYRVLRDDGVMTVQFNHKESGAWDVLAKSLIDAGFEITASWAVSTENPRNLHQAKKNSVSSTVLLVCRKRDPNAPQAWWDDLQPEVANQVEERAPDFEKNDITGIDLYLSAFGPALNVFSRSYPILDSSGVEVRPEVAFAEARKAIANYRFQKLVQTDTAGFDILTQWYLLAWDAFSAREFPFDEARQLALAIGGFNVNDLVKVHKLLDSTSGTCKLLTPRQRLKKRAFSVTPQDFSSQYLVDDIHAIIAIYQEEENVELVRRFMEKTGLLSNEMFMQTIEVALKVIPDKIEEEQTLMNLCLMMAEIKDNVSTQGEQLELFEQQLSLDFGDF